MAYNVPKTLGLLIGRATYVIDRNGIVRHVSNSQFPADQHVAEASAHAVPRAKATVN
jgi:peroxiredoxin Q/BCP